MATQLNLSSDAMHRAETLWSREARQARGCTCASVDIGVGEMHEPWCGDPGPEDTAHALEEALSDGYQAGVGDSTATLHPSPDAYAYVEALIAGCDVAALRRLVDRLGRVVLPWAMPVGIASQRLPLVGGNIAAMLEYGGSREGRDTWVGRWRNGDCLDYCTARRECPSDQPEIACIAAMADADEALRRAGWLLVGGVPGKADPG